jgi:hypothetical protein
MKKLEGKISSWMLEIVEIECCSFKNSSFGVLCIQLIWFRTDLEIKTQVGYKGEDFDQNKSKGETFQ